MLAVHSALWRWIKLWAVIRAYLYAKARLGGTRPIVFDIGARDGLPPKWHLLARAGAIKAVLFEPDPEEAARLRDKKVPALVVEKALGDTQRSATLHVYRSPGLSSVREVHPDMLEKYDYGDVFDEVGRVPLQLHRLQDLIDAAEVPQPHFLKVDVQGFELEVLQGLGSRLDGVVAVELEAQFDEMYRGQATFQHVYEWLFARGFGVLAIRPHWIMGGYNVFEVNVFFGRNAAGLPDDGRRLLDFWIRVNRISSPELMAIRGY